MSEDHQLQTLEDWAGTQNLTLSLVFTDIVDSTKIGIRLADTKWIEALFEHFSTARAIALMYDSYVVKAMGDSLMMAFRRPSEALQFAVRFTQDTGVDYIGIRVGIHSGEVEIRENDIYGLNVNLTSRVQHSLPGEGILVTDSVKRDYERRLGMDSVRFIPREVDLKSFGAEMVYFVHSLGLKMGRRNHLEARASLLTSDAVSQDKRGR
jgi:class 3 adenylate cyclase